MKILCTKGEFKVIVQRCVNASKEDDCQVCIFQTECRGDIDYLPDLCEIENESGGE